MKLISIALATVALSFSVAACGGPDDNDMWVPETRTGPAQPVRSCSSKAASYHHNCEAYGGVASCGTSGSVLSCECSNGHSGSTTCEPDAL